MFFSKTKTRRPPGCGKSRSVGSEENQEQVFLASHRKSGVPARPLYSVKWEQAQPTGGKDTAQQIGVKSVRNDSRLRKTG
jgi:hypothetical protein